MKTQSHKHKKLPTSGIRIRAPKGFTVKVEPDEDRFQVHLYRKLKRSMRKIGTVDLEPENYYDNSGVLKTHSHLQRKYRGKHLGAFLYARAIKFALDNVYKVQSSGMSSDMAIRVWKSKYLRRYFRITQKRNTPYSWMGPTWVARVKTNEKHKTVRR